MNTKLTASLLIASAGAISGSAFASSGYGPVPSWHPQVSEQASQQGADTRTIATQHADEPEYGGVRSVHSESGSRPQSDDVRSLFRRR